MVEVPSEFVVSQSEMQKVAAALETDKAQAKKSKKMNGSHRHCLVKVRSNDPQIASVSVGKQRAAEKYSHKRPILDVLGHEMDEKANEFDRNPQGPRKKRKVVLEIEDQSDEDSDMEKSSNNNNSNTNHM